MGGGLETSCETSNTRPSEESIMLQHARPEMSPQVPVESVDSLLEPMLRAARAGEPLEPRCCGDRAGGRSFVFVATAPAHRDSRSLV
jgi:hypothetical protein